MRQMQFGTRPAPVRCGIVARLPGRITALICFSTGCFGAAIHCAAGLVYTRHDWCHQGV